MATIRPTTPFEAHELRITVGIPDLSEVIVYDADDPIGEGQQFVSATLVSPDGAESERDLTKPENEHLSRLLHDAAEGETVKFVLYLPDPHPVDQVVGARLRIDNYYDGDQIRTSADARLPLPVPEEGTDERTDWEYDWIFPHTGTGRTSGDSAYFVEITACDDPSLFGMTFEFGT